MLEAKANATKMTPEYDRLWHQEIEDILIFLELSEQGVNCPDPMFFDGVFPAHVTFVDELARRYVGGLGAERVGRRTDSVNSLADSLPRIAGGMVTKNAEGIFLLMAARSMDFAAKKRLLSIGGGSSINAPRLDGPWYDPMSMVAVPFRPSIMDRMVDLRSVRFHPDGVTECVHRGVMVRDSRIGTWRTLNRDRALGGENGYGGTSFCAAVMLTAERHRSWTVSVRYQPDRPGVCLATDPVGLREFFRFRDLAPGKSRRDALLHWVTNHWRQDRLDPEAEVFVREYMRGKSRFHWHNLTVDVAIPEPDVMRSEAAKRDRKRPDLDRFKRKRKKRS